MPKNKDPRNEVGAIIYAVVNRALSDYTAKNIFGNVNYANPITSNPIIEAPSAAIFPYTNAPSCAPTMDHPTSDGNGDVATATYATMIATTTMTDDDDATNDDVHIEVATTTATATATMTTVPATTTTMIATDSDAISTETSTTDSRV